MKPTGQISFKGVDYPTYAFRLPNCRRKILITTTDYYNVVYNSIYDFMTTHDRSDRDDIIDTPFGDISCYIPRSDLENLSQDEIIDKYFINKHPDMIRQ